MVWTGHVVFGDTYVAYFGAPDQNDMHAHATYQIVLSANSAATIMDENGTQFTGSAIFIRPLVSHVIIGDEPVALIYLDPQSVFAIQLARNIDTADVACIPLDVLPMQIIDTPDQIVEKLNSYSKLSSNHIDARLEAALATLSAEPGDVSVAQAAKLSNISQSRLRTLVREQFGVPLSTWLLWRKLEKAARALANDLTLAEAALVGGFSDQAHFTRCMRRMFGVTPTDTVQSLARSKTSK